MTRPCPSGKSGYETEQAARKAMHAIDDKRKGGARMHPYRCAACHRWHLGH